MVKWQRGREGGERNGQEGYNTMARRPSQQVAGRNLHAYIRGINGVYVQAYMVGRRKSHMKRVGGGVWGTREGEGG